MAPEVAAVVREGVSNVVRHANARRVDVLVEAADDILVRIADDGDGIPASETRRSGLTNLSRRAEELGGSFDVTSTPGGTTLTWRAPLAGPA